MSLLLQASDLVCARAGRVVVSDVCFALYAGQVLVLTGANGSGKSTLLDTLAGVLPPYAGGVAGADARARVYLGHSNALTGVLSVVESMRFYCAVHGARYKPKVLDDWGLSGCLTDRVAWLSVGQQRRLALACVVVLGRPLWLLDEPLTALDQDGQAVFMRALEQHARAGGAAVVAGHHFVPLAHGLGQVDICLRAGVPTPPPHARAHSPLYDMAHLDNKSI